MSGSRPSILVREAARLALAFTQEGRQRQEAVAPGLAGAARYRAARFRRDVDQVGRFARRGAIGEIEPETAFGEHGKLEAHHMGGGLSGILEIVERLLQHLVDVLMRIALRQQAHQRGQMGHAIDRMRGRQQRAGTELRAFDGVGAEMLVEPRPPNRAHAVAGLQERPHPRAGAAAHEAQVPAVLARQQFDDGGGFAMPPDAQHDALVGPFHG